MNSSTLKIACISNMNNNMFCTTRYLRDLGYNAELILFCDNTPHFLPDADVFTDDYKQFTKTVHWENIRNEKERRTQIQNDLKGYNFFIGCGLVPAFLQFAGITLDVFVPYGADLYASPMHHLKKISLLKRISDTLLNLSSSLIYRIPKQYNAGLRNRLTEIQNDREAVAISRPQYEGICKARYIMAGAFNEEIDRTLESMKPQGKRVYSAVLFLYTPLYNPTTIKEYYKYSKNYPRYAEIRKHNDLIIFHHARHQWKTSPDKYSWKANDKLIKGFAMFVKQYPQCKSKLVMTEYGDDVLESKKLVEKLGISSHVEWFDIMPRKEIMIALDIFDIGCGEFANSWLQAGVMFETLCMGKPLMNNMKTEDFINDYPEIYPFMYVSNETEAFQRIEEYYRDPEYFKQQGEIGRQWVLKYAVKEPIDKLITILKEAEHGYHN